MAHTKYLIDKNTEASFQNNALYCIGTGRMGLALQSEYQIQLKKVQEDIGFSHIRGHGLFCDDVGIYQQYEENGEVHAEYNFTYIDRIFDNYLALGIKPFVELGFMPTKLASGTQTIFYWKGNTTPPEDYSKWAALIKATIEHWFDRYGREEVVTWPFEVWNEPNLPGFWKGADMEEYFRLYEESARAVKACDERIRVGGPAICGVDDVRWLNEFLTYCADRNVPLDIVTRHAYAAEMPEIIGRYDYQKLRAPQVFLDELKESRRIIDSFPQYAGMEMHITEFNTSYTPRNPIHDTNLNAAYTARLLSEMGDTCASYSYWTFGDVFEEAGIAFSPFSGCFGLLSNGSIPKPTYWTFAFFSKLSSEALLRTEDMVVTKGENGTVNGIAWNPAEEEGETKQMEITLDCEAEQYMLLTKTVDEECCNPLKNWLDMGSPSCPKADQLKLLQECAAPLVKTLALQAEGGKVTFTVEVKPNGICYFELVPVTTQIDRGFRRERITGTNV